MFDGIPANRFAKFLLGAIALGATTPMAAQSPEGVIVTGHFGTTQDSMRSVSRVVGYGDLDLSRTADRDVLRRRIDLTARWLCEKLGEPDLAVGPVPSCRDAAVSDAMHRVGTLEAHFAPRGTTWVRGTAWTPPYPETWTKNAVKGRHLLPQHGGS